MGKEIGLQYYQVSKPKLDIVWAPFTLSPQPPPGTMTVEYLPPLVYYSKTDQMLNETTWLDTSNLNLRLLKIYTNKFDDQGTYDVKIRGVVKNSTT